MTTTLYLFDIDGTLLRAGGAGARALDNVFARRHGLSRAMHGIDAGGRTDPWLVAQVFERRIGRAPTAEEVDAILDEYVGELERELTISASLKVLPFVVEALTHLEGCERVGIGIATGNIERGARIKLERAGLHARFRFGGYGCDSEDRGRLVARAIERGRELVGACEPERIVVVGDTAHDITAARACGVRAVAVATGSATRRELDNAGADVVLDTLEQLPKWHDAELG